MKSIIATLLALSTIPTQSSSQSLSKEAEKSSKSLLSVMTYNKSGQLLKTGTGFFLSGNGDAISSYTLFNGADSAVVVDASGKSYPVNYILGADDTYGLVRFSVDTKKSPSIPISTRQQPTGTSCQATTYDGKHCAAQPLSISAVTLFNDTCSYYELSRELDNSYKGSPLINKNGELIGVVQNTIAGKSYAVDTRFLGSLTIDALSSRLHGIALDNIHIPKGLPENEQESLVYLYFKSKNTSNQEYLTMLNLFVSRWPANPEGYFRRSTPLMDMTRFEEADRDLQTYLKLSKEKDRALYNTAQLIRTKLLYQPEHEYSKWTFSYALGLINEAISLNPLMEYKLERAQLYTSMKDYDKAYQEYEQMLQGPDRAPAVYYALSLVSEARGDAVERQIEMLDSALAMYSDPLPAKAANYVLRRGQLFNKAGKYRNAVLDYNKFCFLNNNKVNAQFYYDRSEIEVKAHLYQQALDDLTAAVSQAPEEPLYYIEKAALQLRVNLIDDCIATCQQCLKVTDRYPDLFRILGYAYAQKGNREEALRMLNRAIQLGDASAQELIDKYVK